MSELCFLGTGGSVATEERDNTSFLMNVFNTLVLIDCPGSVIQKIKKLGFNPIQVNHLLVSHIHPDHVYGLPSFIHSLMLENISVNLYGSETTISFCRNLLDMYKLLDKEIRVEIEFISLRPEQSVVLDSSLKVRAYKVPHSSSSLAFHFFLEREKKEVVYSGDTPAEPGLFDRVGSVDYMIHDCSAPSRYFAEYPSLAAMHTSALELGRLARNAEVECLIPCHFFGEMEYEISEIEKEIRKNYKKRLIIPSDFERILI